MHLTIFYDGTCPLCQMEMKELHQYDLAERLTLVDIYDPDFETQYPQIDPQSANRILHAIDDDGRLYLGLDATQIAWNAVGQKTWVNWLRLPVIRWFADGLYLFFAKYRYSISWLLTGKKRTACQSCSIQSKADD